VYIHQYINFRALLWVCLASVVDVPVKACQLAGCKILGYANKLFTKQLSSFIRFGVGRMLDTVTGIGVQATVDVLCRHIYIWTTAFIYKLRWHLCYINPIL